MKLSTETILTTLREQLPYLEEHFGVTQLALFGSYARGDFDDASDIDILIKLKKKDYELRFFLKEHLESVFHKNVDVVYFDSLRPFVKRSVEKDVIYA